MKAIKGVYEHGQVKILEPIPVKGNRNVLIIFPDDLEEQESIKSRLKKRKELIEYFTHHRQDSEPLTGSVKDLVEEGRRE